MEINFICDCNYSRPFGLRTAVRFAMYRHRNILRDSGREYLHAAGIFKNIVCGAGKWN